MALNTFSLNNWSPTCVHYKSVLRSTVAITYDSAKILETLVYQTDTAEDLSGEFTFLYVQKNCTVKTATSFKTGRPKTTLPSKNLLTYNVPVKGG
jgi:hypothetical protein